MRKLLSIVSAILLIPAVLVVPLVLDSPSADAMVLAGVMSSYRAPQAPNAPTSVTATPGSGQNTLTWTASAVDGTHDAATSYDLLWGLSSGSEPNTINGVTSGYVHGGLTNGTAYYYKVRANNAAGSATSSEASGTPTFTPTTFANGATRTITAPDSSTGTVVAYHNANGTLKETSSGVFEFKSSKTPAGSGYFRNQTTFASTYTWDVSVNSLTSQEADETGFNPLVIYGSAVAPTETFTTAQHSANYKVVAQMYYSAVDGGWRVTIYYNNGTTYVTWDGSSWNTGAWAPIPEVVPQASAPIRIKVVKDATDYNIIVTKNGAPYTTASVPISSVRLPGSDWVTSGIPYQDQAVGGSTWVGTITQAK